MIRCCAIFAAALMLSTPCFGQAPSVQEIVQKLRPAPGQGGERLSFRGVRVDKPGNPPPRTSPPTIDLSVNFDFDSAHLTTDALIILDNLGRALNDPALQRYRFMVAGHTDGVGPPEVNMRISEERARAVTDYLNRVHGVAKERLVPRGFGATQLVDPANPANSVNRRVQVTTLGPKS